MTKFIKYYNLYPITDPDGFLGIAPDRDECNIIITLSRNEVMVIKISTQKQIRNWSVLEKLSSKVVYDRRSQKYVGIFGNNAIRFWNPDTSDINKCKKLKFSRNISHLISVDEDTFVLYSDGMCKLLGDAIQSRKDVNSTSPFQHLTLDKQCIINDPNVCTLPGGRHAITYFQRQNNEVEMIRYSLQDQTTMHFSLKRENLNVRIAGYAVIEGENSPMLLTIWSDKRIFLLNLGDSVIPEKSPGNFVSMLTELNVDKPLSVLGISKHFVAIYGGNSGQEGASLLLYNTQFKVVKAKQFFKVYFDFSRLWSIEKNILLAMGQNLSVVSYHMSKEALVELVGSQGHNNFQTDVELDNINEEDPLHDCLQFSFGVTTNVKSKYSLCDEVYDVNEGVMDADGKSIPFESVKEFEHTLTSINNFEMHVDLLEVECELKEARITLMSNYNDDCDFSQEVKLIALQLERCGASEHEITEKLLNALIKADLVRDVYVCLRRYTNISEKTLAKTMNYVIARLSNDFRANKVHNKSTEPHKDTDHSEMEIDNNTNILEQDNFVTVSELKNTDVLSDKFEHKARVIDGSSVLNLLLACSFDESVLALHIRRELDYSKVILILQHLYELIVNTKSLIDFPEFIPHCTIFEIQILRWFGVFLNAHFQKMVLAKDPNLIEIIFKWHKLFILYKREVVDLEKTSALLYTIVQRKKLSKEKNYSKWYLIEEFTLY